MTTQTAAGLAAALPPGMRMRELFDTVKAAVAMPLSEVALLFEHSAYEVRLGACCILDFRARARRTDDVERRRLFDLYLDHHDAIDDWGMVDRAAPSVVGGYLLGRSKAPLHELAASADPIRRRTAITAPLLWIRHGSAEDLAEVFPLAARLAADPEPVVFKAVGIALKHTGARAPEAVIAFLDEHGDTMGPAVVRAARAKLPS